MMRSCPLSSIHHTTFDVHAERKVGVYNRLLWYIGLERVSFGFVLLLLWLRAVQNICPLVMNTTHLLMLGRVFFSLRSTNLRQSWYDRGGRPCTTPYLFISMVGLFVASIKQLYHLPTLTSSVSRFSYSFITTIQLAPFVSLRVRFCVYIDPPMSTMIAV